LKVTVRGQQDREIIAKRNTQDMLSAIKAREPKATIKEIIVLQRLLSGDLLLATLSENARRTLKISKDWLRAVAPLAEVIPTTFPIFVHGVRVKSVNSNEQVRAIAELCKEN
jgi:hypothetical protein